MRFRCDYRDDLVDEALVSGLVERFVRVLGQVSVDPGVRVGELDLLSGRGTTIRAEEVERYGGGVFPSDHYIHELFGGSGGKNT